MAILHEDPKLRDKTFIFMDRAQAGQVLARLMAPHYAKAPDTVIFAIPSGGVPVGIEVARALALPLDLMIVRKIRIPGNPEAGCGAVTLDGQILFNRELLLSLGLSEEALAREIEGVRRELARRNRHFRQGRPMPNLEGQTVLLVDDGLASGFTMLASVETVRQRGAAKIVLAVPTASAASIARVSPEVDEIFCPNVRQGPYFAVAEAYVKWYDLEPEEVTDLLTQAFDLMPGAP